MSRVLLEEGILTSAEGRPCEDIEMTAIYKPRRKTSEETNPADALILDF